MASRRPVDKTAGKPPARAKWVPRGDPDANAKSPQEKEAHEQHEAEATMTGVLEPSVSSGPSYDRAEMLRIFQAQVQVGCSSSRSSPLGLPVQAQARGAEEPETARLPGARRALREMKKAEKLARRSGSLAQIDLEAAGAQTIALSEELQPEGPREGVPVMDAALMAYLSSMAWGMPPVPHVYGGSATGFTTVMLRNIPNRYTRDMLIERLNKSYRDAYDFVYLPIDFNSKCNVGYAFINFHNPAVAEKFMSEFHGAKTKHCLPGFSSAKVCEVTYARVQGRDANMENLRDSERVVTERKEWQPLFFDHQGREIEFSKTLVVGKKRNSRGPGALPSDATFPLPGGYLPPPYGLMGYPTYHRPTLLASSVPQCTLAGVLPGATLETALMLRCVPTSCSSRRIIDIFSSSYKGAYDFLYLPGDSKGDCNRGFLFINLRTVELAEQFREEYHGTRVQDRFPVEGADDERLCEVQSARLASVEKSIMHAQRGSGGKDAWLPLLFSRSGEPAPFPMLAPTAALGLGTPVGAFSQQPLKAVDSRTLEMKMTMEAEATPSSPSSSRPQKSYTAGPTEAETAQKGVGASALAAGSDFPAAYPPSNLPGYGPAMLGMQTAAMAHMSAQAHQAHVNAHAAASAYAGMGMQRSLARFPNATSKAELSGAKRQSRKSRAQDQGLSEHSKAALRKQIEFYFSAANLCKDMYLRSHMDAKGWTPLQLIADFPRVREYRASMAEILNGLVQSVHLEVDAWTCHVRLKEEEDRKRWLYTESSKAEGKEG